MGKQAGWVRQLAEVVDPFERIALFRTFRDGWEPGHRTVEADVADRACALVEAVGPDRVFVSMFDGAVLVMRTLDEEATVTGREVEVLPGSRMSLLGDLPAGDRDGDSFDQEFDLEAAAAWLVPDTRA